MIEVLPDDPRRPDVSALIEQHVAFSRASSPPEDEYALEVDELAETSVLFFSVRHDGELLGIGALKMLDASHAELKSMHTSAKARGQGVGRAILQHLLAIAKERGVTRVSLETGTMDAFAPARALYAEAGFNPCPPFADYRPSANSVCMTLVL